ncbi:AAA family ATPase [Candidatus Giovannonibacteria bacterium]|nr:AAA family ATPase [Candidatus Giovannonibacteria bacterium]
MVKKNIILGIGITGTLGSGKGTAVGFLKKKGFKHYSVSAFIKEEVRKRGVPLDLETVTKVANEIRREHGPAFIVEEIYKLAEKEGGNFVIESLRNPGEISALKAKGNFHIFAVDASLDKRYDRLQSRKGDLDDLPFEKFRKIEEKQMSSTDPNGQNLSVCMKMADYLFLNNGTIQELEKQVEAALEKINNGL